MKESKKELEKAILIVGESLKLKVNTELMLINLGSYTTIKELVYQMFIQDRQQYFEKNDNVFEAISLIKKYCQEMSKNGEVNFEVPYVYNINN
jgi:hypothetical protein